MPDVTALLRAYSDGDVAALDQIVPALYADLRRVARGQLRRERYRQTLDTTVLVHEAYLKLVDQNAASPQDRAHFLGICARAMRQVLVDHARKRNAAKRGGGHFALTLEEERVPVGDRAEDLLALDEALTRLERRNERLARVVECRFFAGLTEEETAAALGAGVRTVQRDWMRARAWLLQDLRADDTGAEPSP